MADLDVVGEMPSSSATIWAKVVSWAWPWVWALMLSTALPEACTRRSAAVGHALSEDVHVLLRPRADDLGEEGDADAHQLAALALLGLLLAELVVAGDSHRLPHGLLVVTES